MNTTAKPFQSKPCTICGVKPSDKFMSTCIDCSEKVPMPLVQKGAKLRYARTNVKVMCVSNGAACVVEPVSGEMDIVLDLTLLTARVGDPVA